MKARVYEEVDVTEWLSGQVRAGCTQVNLQAHIAGLDQSVHEWRLSKSTNLSKLTEEIRVAVECARAKCCGLAFFGLFSYCPERWTHLEMAVFFEEAAR